MVEKHWLRGGSTATRGPRTAQAMRHWFKALSGVRRTGALIAPQTLIAPLTLVVAIGTAHAEEKWTDAPDMPSAQAVAYLDVLRGAGGNVIISPISLNTAVALARAGMDENGVVQDVTSSDGSAQVVKTPLDVQAATVETPLLPDEAVGDALVAVPLSGATDFGLSQVNAVWLDNTVAPSERARTALERDWGLAPVTLDLAREGRARVNDWVYAATDGRIETLLDTDPTDVTVFITSALVFKGLWQVPFDTVLTEPGAFRLADGDIAEVPFMTSGKALPVWDNDAGTFAVLQFAEGHTMLLHMPPEGMSPNAAAPDAVAPDLAAPSFAAPDPAVPVVEETAVDLTTDESGDAGVQGPLVRLVVVPSFALSATQDLTPHLSALGLEEALHDGLATLTETPQQLGPVIQAVRLEVDETGAEAAAATAVAASRSLVLPTGGPMRFDRPFDLYLFDPVSGATAIAAHLADPRA